MTAPADPLAREAPRLEAPAAPPLPRGSALRGLISTARPRQWIKNAFVIAPVIFSGKFQDPAAVLLAAFTTLAFTLIASGTYFLNDLADMAHDREHPRKRLRPIASGIVSPGLATIVGVSLATAGFAGGLAVSLNVALVLIAYWLLQLLYTKALKKEALLDVLCIAIGFVLRVLAGAYAIGVEPSSWLLICTLFLATFLGFGKRAGEIVRFAGGGGSRARPVLIAYHDRLLSVLLSISCSLTLMSYSLYTVTHQPQSNLLVATVPVVAYGLFRYLLLALRADAGQEAESPETLLLRDKHLIAAGLVWGALSIAAIAMR